MEDVESGAEGGTRQTGRPGTLTLGGDNNGHAAEILFTRTVKYTVSAH